MNIIEELSKKYSGIYSEEQAKNVNSPIGKYTYQPKKGLIEVDGTKISVNLNEVGGATPTAEPFRIILYLEKFYKTELTIYPKDFWNNLLDFVFPRNKENIPIKIRKQFLINGDQTLIKKLGSNKEFAEHLVDENVYIRTDKKQTDRIVLTPPHGIKDIHQFEKFITILKIIEKEIKTGGNIG